MTDHRSANGRPPKYDRFGHSTTGDKMTEEELDAAYYDLSRSDKDNGGFVCLYVLLGFFLLLGCLVGWLLHMGWTLL